MAIYMNEAACFIYDNIFCFHLPEPARTKIVACVMYAWLNYDVSMCGGGVDGNKIPERHKTVNYEKCDFSVQRSLVKRTMPGPGIFPITKQIPHMPQTWHHFTTNRGTFGSQVWRNGINDKLSAIRRCRAGTSVCCRSLQSGPFRRRFSCMYIYRICVMYAFSGWLIIKMFYDLLQNTIIGSRE